MTAGKDSGMAKEPAILQPCRLHCHKQFESFFLQRQVGRTLPSYACFFFIFLPPWGWGLKDQLPPLFLQYILAGPIFFPTEKNNRHILGDYSTGVLCDRICSCVTNGAGFLLVSFPFQSSCLLPYTKKKKKKAIRYRFLYVKKSFVRLISYKSYGYSISRTAGSSSLPRLL